MIEPTEANDLPTETGNLPTEEKPANEEKSADEAMASVEKPTAPPIDWKRSDLSDEDRQFARRLKGSRLAAHLSRLSLARLTQLSEATIKFIEKGRTKPTVGTIAYLLQVTELKLTLEDVPLSLREQVMDVLDPPRLPVCQAPPLPPDGLWPCSGEGRAEQLSAAQLSTIVLLLQVPKLKLTLGDIPRRWRTQVSEAQELPREPVCEAAPSSRGLRPCSSGGRPTPPESPPSSP